MENPLLTAYIKQFRYYRCLGEGAMNQLTNEELLWRQTEHDNSISNIAKHLRGNMLSRWTDFMTSDGEKEWRERDQEFESEPKTRSELMSVWDEGWDCLFNTLESLTDEDLTKTIYIRNQGHSVKEAINRQLAHYAYHVGQIVYIAKLRKGKEWHSLSIPKGASKEFNAKKFQKDKNKDHYTDEWVEKKG